MQKKKLFQPTNELKSSYLLLLSKDFLGHLMPHSQSVSIGKKLQCCKNLFLANILSLYL